MIGLKAVARGQTSGGVTSLNALSGALSLTSTGNTVTITPSGTSINLEVSGGASVAFTALTSGTNTTAAMVVGSGASLAASGTGTIAATSAPAAGLTGATLASGVTASSLTSFGSGIALGTPASGVATNLTGTASGLTAGAVTNATFTTALTVNTGTLTLTANSANTSVLTIGAGAVSISGSNTGDQTITLTGAVTGSGTGSFATTIATPGTLNVSSTNSTATAHTHAITSSSAPGAAASLLATDSSGIIGSTGTRIVKGWFTDLTVTNAISGSVTGNAATVTTNANLTGPITSSGNATSVAGAAAGMIYAGATPSFTATPVLGVNASTAGTLGLANGGALGTTITLQNLGNTTAYNWNFPTTAGAVGAILTSGGGASTSNVWLADVATGQVLISGGATTIPSYSATLPSAVQGNITATGALASGSLTTGFTAVAIAQGGTGQTSANAGFNALSPMTTGGDLIYGGASGAATRLANGTAGYLLQANGTTLAPTWVTALANGFTATTQASSDNSTKVATTAYVTTGITNALNGLDWKPAVGYATTANVVGTNVAGVFTYTSTGTDTIDGHMLALNDVVLFKNQTTGADNGVWVVTTAGALGVAGVLTRRSDYNTAAEIAPGDTFYVVNGTTNGNTSWVETATVTTINTDALAFSQVAGPGTYVAGTGLTLTGNSFAVNASQTQITAVGTIATGVWQGTAIGASYVSTLNQNTTGSAASLSISGQTGLMTVTGLTSTNRIKTVRDAADTILELGGSYTPTGTWTSLTLVTPALGTPASGVLTNCTGTASSLTAGNVTTNANLTGPITSVGNAVSTLTAHAVLLGEGTSAIGYATIGTSGRLLIDQGAGADPSFNAMSGDVAINSAGATTIQANAVTTSKINNAAVTYAKIQNESASTLLGNPTTGAQAPEEITLSTFLGFSGTTLFSFDPVTVNFCGAL